ncbi:hypothetical protein HD553DRAFT_347863 [Filobasidium floriforme]|uniref:uncharacterized protein n=1 Tax=Filobasidium floriforme TaxID=5210 RepID=UPI001E8DD4F1|nr:uncharacterized protein HD553DRAFT_347863 [Filobasidium floriforme]KAH8089067.1 hypothetical protein HD553DRAFT_347863 [Filobasidium floriforme]
MPKANKAVKEEDSKPYIQPEGKKAQKSPQKNSEGPWTPDQAWLLFNALYKKDKVDWKMVSEAVGRSSKSCQNGQALYNMPKAPKTAVKNEEDIKPYTKDTDAPTSPQKSSKKSTGEAWTPEQMWALFNAMHPKKDSPNWKEVSAVVGRDVKSCKNGYDGVLKKRLEGIVKGTVSRGG